MTRCTDRQAHFRGDATKVRLIIVFSGSTKPSPVLVCNQRSIKAMVSQFSSLAQIRCFFLPVTYLFVLEAL